MQPMQHLAAPFGPVAAPVAAPVSAVAGILGFDASDAAQLDVVGGGGASFRQPPAHPMAQSLYSQRGSWDGGLSNRCVGVVFCNHSLHMCTSRHFEARWALAGVTGVARQAWETAISRLVLHGLQARAILACFNIV